AAAIPQSDVAVVQYSFDPDRGELSRSELSVPNPDALPPPGTPATLLSRRLRSIQFQYLSDPTTGMRSDWNYVTQAPQQGGQQGGQQMSQQTSANGDTTLPLTVQVVIDLGDSRGVSITYSAAFRV